MSLTCNTKDFILTLEVVCLLLTVCDDGEQLPLKI